MTTFVERVQSIADGDAAELESRVSDRVDTVGDAIGVLESWTEESHQTRAELSSKYETAKTLARDEIHEATGEDAEDLPAEELLTHSAVTDQTKQLLGEYGTKLFAFLDEEQSYEGARDELMTALGAELTLYQRLLADLETGATSVRNAQHELARFAREETPGPPTVTAADVLLKSGRE